MVYVKFLTKFRKRETISVMSSKPTPLLAALRTLTVEEQHQFAKLAGTSRSYLYQLAICHRTSPRAKLVQGISAASVQMHVQTLGRSPKITMDELISMCPVPEA